jgi:hypothetical protein
VTKTAILALTLSLAAGAASAGDFGEAKAACAAAIAKEAGKSLEGAATKTLRARRGAAEQVTVEIRYPDGASATGKCRVKRGAVESLEIQA